MIIGLSAVLILGSGCGQKPSASEEKSNNPLTAPVDYVGAVVKSKQTAQKTVDLANVNRAIQMFYAAEDRYPKDLQELVKQRYLPSLPVEPGARFVYDPGSGQVRIEKIK